MNYWQSDETVGKKGSEGKLLIAFAIIVITGICIYSDYHRPTINEVLQNTVDEIRRDQMRNAQ